MRNMVFISVTHYSELHVPISSITIFVLCHVIVLMFYNVQTTSSTFVGKKKDAQ